MALKKIVDELTEVPEAFRSLYKKEDGIGYVLDLDGDDDASKKKLDDFRTNNRKLFAEKKELEAKLAAFKDGYGGMTPEQAKKAQQLIAKVEAEEEKKLLEAGDLDGLMRLRTAKMQTAHQTELQRVKEARDGAAKKAEKLEGKLASYVIDDTIRKKVTKLGKVANEAAWEDIFSRARTNFTLDEEGNVVAREGKYGEDAEPLKLDDFAQKLPETAPHLFVEAGGGGGGDGDKKKATKTEDGKIVVDGSDPIAMGRHAEAIAAGKAKVV